VLTEIGLGKHVGVGATAEIEVDVYGVSRSSSVGRGPNTGKYSSSWNRQPGYAGSGIAVIIGSSLLVVYTGAAAAVV